MFTRPRVKKGVVSKVIPLKTLNYNDANSCVQEVVKEGLLNMLMDLVEVEDDIDDHYYHTAFMDLCIRDDEIIKPYLGSAREDAEFLANPVFAMDQYISQIHQNLKEIFFINKDVINLLYATMDIKDVEFIREFNGTLLLFVKGNYYENAP